MGHQDDHDAGTGELGRFFRSFPPNTEFELVVRLPDAPPKRHLVTLKDLSVPATFGLLSKVAAQGARCRGRPILSGVFVVAGLTEQQMLALRDTGLPFYAVLQTGPHRYAVWMPDPYRSKLGAIGEPSPELRKILRAIGEVNVGQTGDIPGFTIVKKSGGDPFVCVQLRPVRAPAPENKLLEPVEATREPSEPEKNHRASTAPAKP